MEAAHKPPYSRIGTHCLAASRVVDGESISVHDAVEAVWAGADPREFALQVVDGSPDRLVGTQGDASMNWYSSMQEIRQGEPHES